MGLSATQRGFHDKKRVDITADGSKSTDNLNLRYSVCGKGRRKQRARKETEKEADLIHHAGRQR